LKLRGRSLAGIPESITCRLRCSGFQSIEIISACHCLIPPWMTIMRRPRLTRGMSECPDSMLMLNGFEQ
jgi:hypothetical protein